MQCPKCQFENREGIKFCEECGAKFEIECPACKIKIPLGRKFCGECGYNLTISTKPAALQKNQSAETPPAEAISTKIPTEGERKHVTVLFSDLTGYTALSERLDPEEVKEITSRIFGEISIIVSSYDGFIEKYAGDAVMAIFGVPLAHEDDPIRAVKAACEIHQLVDAISPEVKNRIGKSISMHTGINTGLVVTGEVNMQRGTHGVAGDTINLASRLSKLAKPGEIMVNVDTCRQIEGHFECEYIETATVKGKTEPVQVHKVLSQRNKPVTIHRLSGLRADLVGRNVEMAELSDAVENLRQGQGRIFSICGAAGTGKSRLVEEFKAGLDLNQVQWIEGHAYAYSQNIPYFPLIDLLNRLLCIEEKDPPEKVREKVESGLGSLVTNRKEVIPYLGLLYSLDYPETKDISPEHWKSRLQSAIMKVLSALSDRAPTVFFLEDLHWADPSFVELLRRACLEIRQPAIVLCAYRPTFTLFTGHQISHIGKNYHDIQLQNLSLSVAHEMLASLLKTESIPSDLKRWVNSKAEGNPFYLEELVNSLIESDTLTLDNGDWKLSCPITESDIPSSLYGLVSGRLDRLEKHTKRVLQEASVIGRDFLYEILKNITAIDYRFDRELGHLERLDLIRIRSFKPDLEYMFKHALTQEIAYNTLLKKQRREIHEKIARVMESVFSARLSEFYEALAFHFNRGQSVIKAVYYLMNSAEKSLKKYAVEESHYYYGKAFDLLGSKQDRRREEDRLLIELLTKWALVFYYRGNFKKLTDLLFSYESLAEQIDDKSLKGMFYAWLGFALDNRCRCSESYEYLNRALKYGEEIDDHHLIGYACTWLIWSCANLGRLDDAVVYGKRAQKIAGQFKSDHYLYFKSLAGMGVVYFFKGECRKALEAGQKLVEFGINNSNRRSECIGHYILGYGHCAAGNFSKAIESCKLAIRKTTDPFYSQVPNIALGISYVLDEKIADAKQPLEGLISFGQQYGFELGEKPARAFLAVISVVEGQMQEGVLKLKKIQSEFFKVGALCPCLMIEHILGKIFLQLFIGATPGLGTIARNIGFLVREIPFAAKKAENHLKKAVETAKEIGANGILGQAYLDLGLLYKAKKKKKLAREFISDAIHTFECCGAEVYHKRAKGALENLDE